LSTYLPPTKCLPLNHFTNGFGAVKLTNVLGINFAPGPEDGGPSSIFQDEGASTDVTGSLVSSRALMTAGKGSRTSPENEKPLGRIRVGFWKSERDEPKIASMMWSVSFKAEGKSSVKGTSRFLS
jgi:hypothetical protein